MAGFPNVPKVPGVPPLIRGPLYTAIAIPLLTRDLVRADAGGPVLWGIFQNGQPVVFADSAIALDYKQDWDLLTYPIEEGAFQTYNKVQVPFDTRVRLATGGSQADRQDFLDSIAAIAGTLELYDVVTPEVTYQNVNVRHYDYKRTGSQGAGLITVDIWLEQIRQTATAAFTNTRSPAGADAVNNGTVQTQPPTAAQLGIPAGVN